MGKGPKKVSKNKYYDLGNTAEPFLTLPFRFILLMPIAAIQSTLLAPGKMKRCLEQPG